MRIGRRLRRALSETRADARHEARQAVTPVARLTARARGWVAIVRAAIGSLAIFDELPLRNLGRDIRYGCRRLRRAPTFTIFAVLILALGIGATTAIYSAVYALVLRPMNIRDIDRVVNLYHSKPPALLDIKLFSWPDYQDLRAQQTVFSQIAAWTPAAALVTGHGATEIVRDELVGGGFFSLVGATAERGRLIDVQDDRPGAPLVAVISHVLWVGHFGADPDVVGKTVRITAPGPEAKSSVFEIVGVVSPQFRGVSSPSEFPTQMWMPLATAPQLGRTTEKALRDRDDRLVFVKGRLKRGVSIDQARADVTAIADRLDATFPLGRYERAPRRVRAFVSRPWAVVPAADVHAESQDEATSSLALAALLGIGLVLLVACSNLANLTLARAANRAHELAVRRALGATRWRLFREDVVESGVVALAGGGAGLLTARALMGLVAGGIPIQGGVVMNLDLRLDAPVLLLAGCACGSAWLFFGVLPALGASRADLPVGIQAADRGVTLRWRGRRWAIGFQVAVSVVLLTLAGLAVDQIRQEAEHDPGFDYWHLAGAAVTFVGPGRDETSARQTMTNVLREARTSLRAEHVALVSALPVGPSGGGDNTRLATAKAGLAGKVPTGDGQGWARTIVVSPEGLATLGIAVDRGRSFTPQDVARAAPVAVVSKLLATQVFGTTSVLGRRLLTQQAKRFGETAEPPAESVTIVGIAADTDVGRMGLRRVGVLYLPYAQHFARAMMVLVRTTDDPVPVAGELHRLVVAADPDDLVTDAGTGAQLTEAEHMAPKVISALTGPSGAFALLLSLVGLHGVLSHVVARRRREIGVRMALGADPGRIAATVLREGLTPVAAGLIMGLGASLLARMAFQPLLVRLLPAMDTTILAFVPLPFLIAAFFACWLPARRAARVDPAVALRQL